MQLQQDRRCLPSCRWIICKSAANQSAHYKRLAIGILELEKLGGTTAVPYLSFSTVYIGLSRSSIALTGMNQAF